MPANQPSTATEEPHMSTQREIDTDGEGAVTVGDLACAALASLIATCLIAIWAHEAGLGALGLIAMIPLACLTVSVIAAAIVVGMREAKTRSQRRSARHDG